MDNAKAWPTAPEILAFEELRRMVEESETVAVCAHTNPDGDALGSVLGLTGVLRAAYPTKDIVPLLADDEDVPSKLAGMSGTDALVRASVYHQAPDLFIALDTPTAERLNNGAAVMRSAKHTASLDHHPSREPFAEMVVCRPEAAAAGVIVADFVEHCGYALAPEQAQCLYLALMTDTGGFQYQNTDACCLRTAARLVECGADPAAAAEGVYQSESFPSLKLRACALARLEVHEAGFSTSYITAEDMGRLRCAPDDADGLIDVVRSLGGVSGCVFLRESKDGSIRANLRSKVPWLDVSAVAASFGGGGHRLAAGCTLRVPMEEALRTLSEAMERQIRSSRAEASGR